MKQPSDPTSDILIATLFLGVVWGIIIGLFIATIILL